MNKVLGIFQESFPLEDDKRVQLVHSLFISAIVVLILFVFKPIGLAGVVLPVIKLVPVYIGYGVVTLLACIAADRIIRPAFPSFFDDQKWTVIKHIGWTVLTIMIIALANLFFSRALGFTGISGSLLLTFLVYTFAVSVLPITVITIIRCVYLLARNRKMVRKINDTLKNPVIADAGASILVFNSEDGKEVINLQSDQFMYAESSDNYTDIVYIENGIVRRALIHTSLKRIEGLNAADFVIRVHRAFLVNIRKVKNVTGNAQGYRLRFENLDESVPVAQRMASNVRELIAKVHGG